MEIFESQLGRLTTRQPHRPPQPCKRCGVLVRKRNSKDSLPVGLWQHFRGVEADTSQDIRKARVGMERLKDGAKGNSIQRSAVILTGAIQPFESFVFLIQRYVNRGDLLLGDVFRGRDFLQVFKDFSSFWLPAHSRVCDRESRLRLAGPRLRFFEQCNRLVIHSLLAIGVGDNWSLIKVIWIELEGALSLSD